MAYRSKKERAALLREIRMRQGTRSGISPALIAEVQLDAAVEDERLGHAADVPAVQALRSGLALDPRVTFLTGDNGAGKSTLVEAIAVAAGMNAEGGGRNLRHTTRPSHSPLGDKIRLVRGVRTPKTDFFLRAESVFTVATALEEQGLLDAYGGESLHERSHGEAFLAILLNRFGPEGFYVLDEPEAALSPQNVLTLIRRIDELVEAGSQFVIATHSPLLLAYPKATILRCDQDGLTRVDYEDAPPVALTRRFLDDPASMLRAVLQED